MINTALFAGIFDTYQNRLLFSRVSIVALAAIILLTLICHRVQFKTLIKRYFSEKYHPLNLAVFRTVLFAVMLTLLLDSHFVTFAHLSKGLEFPVLGMGWLLRFMPFIREYAPMIYGLSLLFCITSMIGLFTRVSIGLSILLGFVVLGMRNMLGDTYHINHVVLFAMILFVSDSGDYLSCDALIRAGKSANRGQIISFKRSRNYCLPLRYVGLLIGVIYFFPGFWKVWKVGFDWIFTDTIKYLFHWIWYMHKDWVPSFRMDQYPVLYRAGALGTVIFEVSFIFLILFERLRYLAVGLAVVFHYLLNMFLRVSFYHLQWCYVVFFDWYKFFRFLGLRIFKDKAYVYFNQNNKKQIKRVALLKTVDIFGRLEYLHKDFDGDMCLRIKNNCWRGINMYHRIFIRSPIFWVCLPFSYSLTFLGEQQAVNFNFPVRPYNYSVRNKPIYVDGRKESKAFFINLVSVLLIITMSVFGAGAIVKGWPFACYPTFAHNFKGYIKKIEIRTVDRSNVETIVPFDVSVMWIAILFKTILEISDVDEQRERLASLWDRLREFRPEYNSHEIVRFYEIKESTDPDLSDRKLFGSRLLHEIDRYSK